MKKTKKIVTINPVGSAELTELEKEVKTSKLERIRRLRELYEHIPASVNCIPTTIPELDVMRSSVQLVLNIPFATAFKDEGKKTLIDLAEICDSVGVSGGAKYEANMTFMICHVWKDFYALCPDHDAADDYQGSQPGYWRDIINEAAEAD